MIVGAVLAGGAGRRLGRRSKPTALLGGRPLVSYPVAALAQVCERVAVVCKRETELPALPEAERWDEPDKPRHPRVGIVYALERACGPVLVCAADMPFVTADACRTLLTAADDARAVVAVAAGVLQPVLGLYSPAVLHELIDTPRDSALTATVAALEPVRVALPPAITRSVNTPEELAEAEALLTRG